MKKYRNRLNPASCKIYGNPIGKDVCVWSVCCIFYADEQELYAMQRLAHEILHTKSVRHSRPLFCYARDRDTEVRTMDLWWPIPTRASADSHWPIPVGQHNWFSNIKHV